MDYFYELYKNLPKQGPGDNETTIKALSYIKDLEKVKQIVDAGCGSGRQTMVLAEQTTAQIHALETYDPQVEAFKNNKDLLPYKNRIQLHQQSMDDLSFIKEPVDLIWSEGAIYNVGMEKGLRHFQQHLSPKGWVGLTEISWFKDLPSGEVKKYWLDQYPDMKSVEENISIFKACGFQLVQHFPVPHKSWWTDYYEILEPRVIQILNNKDSAEEAREVALETQKEIEMYKKFGDQYGYEFFIAKKA